MGFGLRILILVLFSAFGSQGLDLDVGCLGLGLMICISRYGY